MEKFICIHGHFYQPPRENPWLESVELQDSASPYHDWNERITVECYAPNATARILDGEGRIAEITNTYSKISFNFGPTLLAWMRDKMPEIHDAIVAADRLSRERYSGHGSALAQVYNHMILPLANPRDKYTQVLWGLRDFEYRFGRPPEGMWLAETASDTDTLETLAQLGLKFTLLSPYQASRARELGKRNWRDVNGGQFDPTRGYRLRLPSGKSLTVFFYDGPVSQAVAFENLLSSGERLAHRLMSAFNDRRQWDQLVHIATDGESYGHHHRHGEMALAYALHYIESNHLARLTNYAEYLEKHPPTHEVQLHEKTAWSCTHGVGRWMADCGCNSGGHPGWNQGWRTPLRQSLDWLRDELAPLFEARAKEYLHDAWQARDAYIGVISSIFQQYGQQTRIFSYRMEDEERQLLSAGKTRLALGRSRVTSEITLESEVFSYAILYLGEHNVTGGVRRFDSDEAFQAMSHQLKAAFDTADVPQTIRLIDRHFGEAPYSLRSLFKDEQRRILNDILASTREDLESRFRLITERYTPLMKFLLSAGAPLPPALETARDMVLQSDIRRQIEAEQMDLAYLQTMLQEAQAHDGQILDATISYVVKNKMEQMMQHLAQEPADLDRMHALETFAHLVMPLPLGLNLWKVQNTYWEMLQRVLPEFRQRAQAGDQSAQAWLGRFLSLGDRLGFAVKHLDTAPAALPPSGLASIFHCRGRARTPVRAADGERPSNCPDGAQRTARPALPAVGSLI